ANNLTFATAIGSGAVVNNSNYVVLGRPADAVRIPGFLDVKGNTYLKDLVASNGDFSGRIVLDLLGAAGSTDLCWNIIKQIATCSSSLRYKTNVNPFLGGLDVVRRLRPITFNWKDGGTRDIGFAAEEVNEIEPLLSTHNAQGEIEGVKYKQITTVLVNAVKEQQQLIEQQQQQLQQKHQRIEKLETRLAALEAVVRKIGPGFTAPGELRNHRTRSVLRSRAPGRQPTRRLDRLVPAFITSTEYISSGSAWW
ncbi:MAG: tail fiber domain-containing protein, partial [Pyrinomonadaceae bacterium]